MSSVAVPSAPVSRHATFIDVLRHRAQEQPDRLVYTYLSDDGQEQGKLTYGQLDEQARAIAAALQQAGASGQRAVMLYPSSLEFVTAFFGCLYANVVAVPAYPPEPARLQRTLPRLQAIVKNARATKILTTAAIKGMAEFFLPYAPELGELEWIATDTVDFQLAAQWQRPQVGPQTLAFLQYTSGSTSTPKGVMITHGNLMANQAAIKNSMQCTSDTICVSWLPLFHDMGLIGNTLHTVYLGFHTVLMSPITFLQNPFLWLKAISDYRATATGAPNFAYELCNRKVTAEQRAQLNLSTWGTAYNGAEPVRPETLAQFVELFAPCGLRPSAVQPVYGLAEATLIVSGANVNKGIRTMWVDRAALEKHEVRPAEAGLQQARHVVSSGNVSIDPDQRVIIVDPETCVRRSANQVGEIWVSSRSVARGYWDMSDETEQTFHAHLSDTGEGPFLRTGDLGFLREDGELFITGRCKDLIIIRGANHYPQDLERTVERKHPSLRPGCGAAFCVEMGGEERLVVVQEVDERTAPDLDELLVQLRTAITETHGVQPFALVLVKARSIPKTSSGKIQRRASRAAFLAGELEVVREWRQQGSAPAPAAEPARVTPPAAEAPATSAPVSVQGTPESPERPRVTRPASEIQAFLISRIAEEVKLGTELIDPKLPFTALGLDSATEVILTKAMEDFLGVKLAANLTWEYPNIDTLSRYLAGEDVVSVTAAARAKLAAQRAAAR